MEPATQSPNTPPPRTSGRGRIVLSLAILLAIAAAGLHWTATHYVVKMPQGTAVIPKRYLDLGGTVIDARSWNYENFTAHPELTAAMRRAGYGDILDALRKQQIRSDLEALGHRSADRIEAWKTEASKAFDVWWKETMDYWRPATNAAAAQE